MQVRKPSRQTIMYGTLQYAAVVIAAASLMAAPGCSPKQPPPIANTAPPPPPPLPEPPPPPPPKVEADPYEAQVAEVGKILQRYVAIYGEIRDEASADKAVQEIGHLTTRLRELADAITKTPYRPTQTKHTLALQSELTRIAQGGNPEMQRVLTDPDIALKVIPAQQSFVLEGVSSLGQAILARQPTPPTPGTSPTDQPPATQSTAK